MSEWVEWHRGYDSEGSLSRRLEEVKARLGEALDSSPAGLIRVISICAGDGRDLLGVLGTHPRRDDVSARLVELEPLLARRARERAEQLHLERVEVVCADASTTDAFRGAVPADIVLACGIFGNVTDQDVRRTIELLPELCAPGATVVWTRGRFVPDLTPAIRSWFAAAAFIELAFVPIPGGTASVGVERLSGQPRPYRPGVRLFTFLPAEFRPSRRPR
ncbi:MAG TPA: class I SAM-dependent methyltransferase [Candidatus Binatia bacterium]|nr:class I SAM-dependent methyltransferase [Candidatus Binatia bacterium]